MEYAPTLFNALRGTFCIYKPTGVAMQQAMKSLRVNLSKDLNAMPCRPPRQRPVFITSPSSSSLPVVTTVPDLADHTLVLGQRYLEEDFGIQFIDGLSAQASGVVVMMLNQSRKKAKALSSAKYLRAYHVEGEFGTATQDFTPLSHVVEKSSYRHITQYKLDRILATIQSAHQRHMFTSSGVDPQSQEAYELACQGFLRPDQSKTGHVIYMVKCIEFRPPKFTLEVHTVNETFASLASLVHELGLELRSTAICTQVRRLRYGHFTLSHALLREEWKAQNIWENIGFCRHLTSDDKLLHSPGIKQLLASKHTSLPISQNGNNKIT